MSEENSSSNTESSPVLDDIEKLESQLESGGDFVPEPSDTEPEKKKESSGVGEMCSMMVEMLCGRMALAYNEPGLALTAPEKEAFTESINDVVAYYDLDMHPLIGFGMVSVGVTLPRYMMVEAITKSHENKKPGDDNGDKS